MKRIIDFSGRISQGNGTSKYQVTWEGDWTEEELINFCDGGSYNYGGRIEGEKENEDGTKSGIVCVYYD